jgi:hypothetical protein
MNGRATARTTTTPAAPSARTATPSARTATPSARTAVSGRGGAVPVRTTTRGTPRATPRPELRLVPGAAPAAPRRRASILRHRRAPFVLLVVALLVGTTLGLLVLNTAIAVDSLEATQLRAENAQRAQEVQRLERQVVTGGTPAEVARAAVAAGLVPAGPAAYLVIGPDGTSVLRGTPQPAGSDAEDGD